ncbi:MAG: ABC transporter substrate-binding protein [Clostridia bacterium]
MKRRVMIMAVLALAFTGLVFAAGSQDSATPAAAAPAAPAKTTITVALPADITSLDPMGHNDIYSEKVSHLLFDGLFKFDTNFKAVPDLVESWSQPSGTEWVFKLKKGVKFHDGSELTAEDVKFSLDRSKTSPKVQHVLAEVVSVEVVDSSTVKVTTKTAFAPFLFTLAHAGVSIVPKKYAESADNWANPVGSGPYQFVQWVSGDKVVLRKNAAYYDAAIAAQAESLVFKVIPEPTSRTIALETGEVDAVIGLDSNDVQKVGDNAKLKVVQKPSTDVQYIGMNIDKAPFDNVLVRQAVNYAIDKESVLVVALNGNGVEATSIIPTTIFGHKDGPYSYDPAKAKQLLAQAGYDNSQVLKLWASGDVRKKIAEVVQANLNDVGIKTEIEMFEWGAYLTATNSGNQGIFLLGWSSNPDPDSMLTPLFAKASIGGQNRTRYVNEQVEKYLLAGRVELDLAKRQKIYNDLSDTVMKDAPWVPLYTGNNIVGVNAALKNVELSPQGLWNLEKLHY